MKKVFILVILLLMIGFTYGCQSKNYDEIESIITSKEVVNGSYVLHLEYELDGFEDKLSATETVSKAVFDRYQVGDSYVFKRPIFEKR